jgi:hypothetical protein
MQAHQYLHIIHCGKMSVNDAWFCHYTVTEFLIKMKNSAVYFFDQHWQIYGDSCLDASRVQYLVKHFKDCKRNTDNLPHSSWLRTATMKCNTQKVDVLIIEDWKVTVMEIIAKFDIGPTAIQEMIKTLRYQKGYCHWVPQLLTNEHKQACMDVYLQLFQWHAAKGSDFMLNIMTWWKFVVLSWPQNKMTENGMVSHYFSKEVGVVVGGG